MTHAELGAEGKYNVAVWYDFKTGRIKAMGRDYEGKDCVSVRLEVEDSGILPLFVPNNQKAPGNEETGLIKVLDSVMEFRKIKFNAI